VCVCVGGETEKDRESKTDRETETDRNRQRERERERDRERNRKRDVERDRGREREITGQDHFGLLCSERKRGKSGEFEVDVDESGCCVWRRQHAAVHDKHDACSQTEIHFHEVILMCDLQTVEPLWLVYLRSF